MHKAFFKQLYWFFMLAIAVLLAVFFFYGLFSPLADAPMEGELLAPPSKLAWLGTNNLGQDLLLKTILATPATLFIGLGAGFLTLSLAILFASLSLSVGKNLELLMLRVLDAFLIIPSLVLAMLIAAYILPSTLSLILLLGILQWANPVRQIRGLMIKEMLRESYKQAKLMGAGNLYLIRKHLLPKLRPFFITLFISAIKQSIIHASGLAFLGITDPSSPTWGGILAEALPMFDSLAALWLIVAPAFTLFFLLFFLTLLSIELEKRY